MPIFAYRCQSCGFEKDVLQKRSDPPLTDCPACSRDTFARQLTAPAFQLKGSGWYVTDFRDNGKGKSKPSEGGESGSASPSGDGASGKGSSTDAGASAGSGGATSSGAADGGSAGAGKSASSGAGASPASSGPSA